MTEAEDDEAIAAMIREMRRDFREFREEMQVGLEAIMDDLRGAADTIGAIDAHLSGCRLTTERTLRVLRGGKK